MSPAARFPLPRPLRKRIDRIGQEFLAEFLARATRRHPTNVEALAELAGVLTQLGRLEEGLAADAQLVDLVPENPTVHYNLACSLALLGRKEAALDALERAIQLGYDDHEHLLQDSDLRSLRRDARFRELVVRLGGAP
jgi:Flp pilus assembly protein TadD